MVCTVYFLCYVNVCMQDKNFSRHFEIFFLIFYRKKALAFHANCLLNFLGKFSLLNFPDSGKY